jgi:hypothetical protein
MRRSYIFYLVACALVTAIPYLNLQSESAASGPVEVLFPGWPTRFEGKTLTPLALTELEKRFNIGFPGRIGRFSDGEREIIVRWVTEATRKMHPASDCFQGLGYTVKPLALHRDDKGLLWASFNATKGDNRLRVYERIYNESGESWTDVSAWYWAAMRYSGNGPWWAITVAEKEP